jgi:hypothetical protein
VRTVSAILVVIDRFHMYKQMVVSGVQIMMLLMFAERSVQPAPISMFMLILVYIYIYVYQTDVLELLCCSSMTFSVVMFAGLHGSIADFQGISDWPNGSVMTLHFRRFLSRKPLP